MSQEHYSTAVGRTVSCQRGLSELSMCALCQTRVYVPSSLHLSSSSGMVVLVVIEVVVEAQIINY